MVCVGYIGLGAMGLPLAMAALGAGFDVSVHDIKKSRMREAAARGARPAATPSSLAAQAEIIAVVVKGDALVEQVLLNDGALAAARPGNVLVIHSTVHPRTIRKIAACASSRGVEVVDAQLTGGQHGAEARALCFMVGGQASAIERIRPLLQSSAREIHVVGGPGAGATMKLVQQTIFCLNRLAAYEGMRLAERAGLDLETVQRVLKSTAAQSFVLDHWLARYRILENGAEPPGWTIAEFSRLLLSLTPALELGREMGVALPATALVQQLFVMESPEPRH
jgi:2-hydroxy-3-oxopropionate reductase